jgi:hypothetical protein
MKLISRRALSTRNKALPGSCGNPVISPGDPAFYPIVLLRSPDKSTIWLLTDLVRGRGHEIIEGLNDSSPGPAHQTRRTGSRWPL